MPAKYWVSWASVSMPNLITHQEADVNVIDLRGLTDKFEPWRRACTYVYCTSAVIRDQSSKDELTRTIREFLRSEAPRIRDVIVLDWGALSFWLNTLRRVADSWLGTGCSGITAHQEYIASLAGFRGYLLAEKLAYEPPAPQEDTHPDVLWKWFSQDNDRHQPGLVLYGPGGVGKSRVCVEVAVRAHADGWRVLHVSPTEECLTEKDLMAAVASGDRPTLVCFDYIDYMYGLDYINLVRDAASRGVRMRYLANSRPMWAETAQREPATLEGFSFRELRMSEEQCARL